MTLSALGDGWGAEPPWPGAIHHVSDTKLALPGRAQRAGGPVGGAFMVADLLTGGPHEDVNSFIQTKPLINKSE